MSEPNNTTTSGIKIGVAARFNPTNRYTFETRLTEIIIEDYWEYLIKELPARGLINTRELEYLKKSGLLGRFISENQSLISCFRIGCG